MREIEEINKSEEETEVSAGMFHQGSIPFKLFDLASSNITEIQKLERKIKKYEEVCCQFC